MDFRRYLPLIVIAFVLLLVLPQLLNRGKSSTLNSKGRATLTQQTVNLIARDEAAYLAAHGSYTSSLADLVAAGDKQLAADLTIGILVNIDVGTAGKTLLVRASSDVISYARAISNGKVTAASCRILKSSSGVKCPQPATKPKPAK
jgi:competence protein ComGC